MVPKDAKKNQVHLYEDNGIEFIEKTYDVFEEELKLIYANGIEEYIPSLSKWIISFKSMEFDRMTLREFFEKAIPDKGEYKQEYLKGLKKTCFDFCINTIERLELKKKPNSIKDIKSNMEKGLNKAKGSKHFNDYQKAFNRLFSIITK